MSDHFYKTLKIERFRGIKSLEIKDLARVNLFVGRNNCGKTTLLEAVFVLSGMSNPGLLVDMEGRRGRVPESGEDLQNFFYRMQHTKGFVLSGANNGGGRTLSVRPEYGNSPTIQQAVQALSQMNQHVRMQFGDNGPFPPERAFTTSASELAGLTHRFKLGPAAASGSDEYMSVLLYQDRTQGGTMMDPRYAETLLARFTHPSGKHNAAAVGKMIIENRKDEVLRYLRGLEDSVSDLTLDPSRTVYLSVGMKRQLPLNNFGDGATKMLQIFSDMHVTRDGILLDDEIGNGLHVASVRPMWEMILRHSAETNTQLFLTTHSHDVVKALADLWRELSESDTDAAAELERSVACFWLSKHADDVVHAYPHTPQNIHDAMEVGIDVRRVI